MTAQVESDPSLIEPQEFVTDEFRINPFPIYKRLREHEPVYQDKFQNRWIISRYEDIWAIYKDNERFTRAIYDPHGKFKYGSDTPLGQTLNELGEGQDYIWLRGIVAGEFVGKRLEKRVPLIERIARKIIDGFMEKARTDQKAGLTSSGQVDLVSQFSARFPIRVIAGMLGLPEEDNDYFEAVYDRLFAGGGYGRAHYRLGMAARDDLFAYLDPLIDERIAEPRDDLLSTFCHAEKDGEKMTRDQMRGYVALLLVGGGDTTHKAIDAMWWNLLRSPEQYEAVRDNPELMDQVFTEMLRFDGSNHWQRRRTKVEVELRGRVMPVGATAWLGLGSGNRDETHLQGPEHLQHLPGRPVLREGAAHGVLEGRGREPPRVRAGDALLHGLRARPPGVGGLLAHPAGGAQEPATGGRSERGDRLPAAWAGRCARPPAS